MNTNNAFNLTVEAIPWNRMEILNRMTTTRYVLTHRMVLIFILGFFLSSTMAFSQQPPRAPARAEKAQTGRFVTIDFNNVDIVVFIKFISELTGKNFIIDQRVRGKVTIISPAKISIEEAYKVFESVLQPPPNSRRNC